MLKKISTNKLLIVFFVLVILFLFVKFFRSPLSESNFITDFEPIDTSLVSSVYLFPQAEKGEEIVFTRNTDGWTVSKKGITAEAQSSSIQSILNEISILKPQRLAAKNKDKWEDYKVTDTSGTKLIVKSSNGKELLNIIIGKFSFQQQNQQMGYGRNVSGTSYIRFSDDEKIYAVNGFLSMSFNMEFNSFRKQDFIKFNKDDVKKLVFKYPSDSSYTLSKTDSVWVLENGIIQQNVIDDFLNLLAFKNNNRFIDDFTPQRMPDYELVIEGDNMSSVTISVYIKSEAEFVLNSSLNSKSYFISSKDEIFSEVFKSRDYFISH
jgi:hypothetical protein